MLCHSVLYSVVLCSVMLCHKLSFIKSNNKNTKERKKDKHMQSLIFTHCIVSSLIHAHDKVHIGNNNCANVNVFVNDGFHLDKGITIIFSFYLPALLTQYQWREEEISGYCFIIFF